jgi:hypothetical protein
MYIGRLGIGFVTLTAVQAFIHFVKILYGGVTRGFCKLVFGNRQQECYWAPVASHTCAADALGICSV